MELELHCVRGPEAVGVLRLPVRYLLHVLLAPPLDLLAVAGKVLQLLSQAFLERFQLCLGTRPPVLFLLVLLELSDFLLNSKQLCEMTSC